MKFIPIRALFAAASLLLTVVAGANADNSVPDGKVARGRYLVQTSGCNDCHTAGYMPSSGKVPEEQWLMGDSLGWRGPWGTTYAINLRLFAAAMNEDQWVQALRASRARFPMPWWALQEMDEADLRAIHAYIRSLPVAGAPAPAYVPPEQEPKTPYFTLVMPPAAAQQP